MDNAEYREIINRWTDKVNSLGITLSNGKPVPTSFWKTFLGISYTVHIEIMNDTYKRKVFSPNLERTIQLASRLDERSFKEEVLLMIPLFEGNKFK